MAKGPAKDVSRAPYRTLARLEQRVLIGLGVCLMGVSLLAVWTQQAQTVYQQTAVPYLKQHLPTIASWDADRTWRLFDGRVQSSLDPDEFQDDIAGHSKLGRLTWLGEPEFHHVMAYAGIAGASKRVSYVIPARFEAGDAEIAITLSDRKGALSVHHFDVDRTGYSEFLSADTRQIERSDLLPPKQ